MAERARTRSRKVICHFCRNTQFQIPLDPMWFKQWCWSMASRARCGQSEDWVPPRGQTWSHPWVTITSVITNGHTLLLQSPSSSITSDHICTSIWSELMWLIFFCGDIPVGVVPPSPCFTTRAGSWFSAQPQCQISGSPMA